MRFLLINCLIFGFSLSLLAQNKPNTNIKSPEMGGYAIPVTLLPFKNTKIYLGSYFGKSMTLVDSAQLNEKSQGVFKGSKKLTGGIYFLVSPNYTLISELLMDEKQQFSITGDTLYREKIQITGSQDNTLFKQYSLFSIEKGKLRQDLDEQYKMAKTPPDSARIKKSILQLDSTVDQFRNNIIQKYPKSLLTMLFNAMKRPTAPSVPVIAGKPDSLYPYRYVKDHFWDEILFNDDRLLRTPFFESKLDEYFKYYVSPEPDSIISEVKQMLLTARTGKEIYPYLLTKFTNKYINPEYMGQDNVFVYLFENFYAKGDTNLLNPASRKTITDRAYSLMANQLGQPAPVLNLTDSSGKISPLYQLKAYYTLVAFWDPTCGHCKTEIPQLDSMYRAKWKAMGVAVYSVNVNEKELTAWKAFINEKKISRDWVQVYQTKEVRSAEEKAGIANFRQLYDVFKTPTLYLLDKDKRIIAKQLTLQQFDAIMEAKRK